MSDLHSTEKLLIKIEAGNKLLLEESSKLASLAKHHWNRLRYTKGKIKSRDEEIKSHNVVTFINTALKGVQYSKQMNFIFDLVLNGEMFGKGLKDAGQQYAHQVSRKVPSMETL